MASIEVITSREKEITVTKANGETSVGTVRIWNETVSNLTLMASPHFGPKSLLQFLQICPQIPQISLKSPPKTPKFPRAIPAGESRRIKHLRVFFVTASWSIFAYIWLYLILAVITPGVVQVWEAFLTLLFFPACVVFAWAADKRLLFYKYVYKRYRADPRSGIIIGTEAERPPKDLAGFGSGMFEADSEDHPKGKLVAPLVATVTILDDDHAGIFGFRERSVRVSECQGHVEVTVVRSSGARGTVMVPFRTVEGTARGGGVDYEDASGELEFRNDETAKTLQVKIVDDEEYEKKENFFIELGTPRWLKRGISALLLAQGDGERALSAEEEEERGGVRLPSCFDYVMHFLTVFWKVLFACVPPTALLGGWAAFGVSILLLALLTALIGDLAAHFGCTLGLKDSVNAVVFVALGTSIP
ncbi:sodium/calcium exchanger 2-like, partial [Geospiza fortis]|uniref:Sodium/calcium exchanger 2-like n=1 Tax=Geospiza fortis TaxID=48883 RepID=A0A8N5F2Q9_GEOFO